MTLLGALRLVPAGISFLRTAKQGVMSVLLIELANN
jgi:hypothetical protein